MSSEMDPWDELLVEPPEEKVEPTKTQKSEKTQKTTIKKDQSRTSQKKVEPPTQQTIEIKILDEEVIWSKLCDLRGSIGIDTLLGWLTTKPPKNVNSFEKIKVEFKRSNIVLAIIKLYRELKKEAYL